MGYSEKLSGIDEIYRNLPPDEIPWNREEPPEALVELVESGRVQPCRCIDLGCGTGNYVIFLARKGFTVTGIDASPAAISIAKEKAEKKGAQCDFLVADVLHAKDQVQGTFDFAYDWEVLHHVFPEEREQYCENVFGLLNSGGRYLSVCFSNQDPGFGGSGKYRETPLGTVLYFSSDDELWQLFSQYFTIAELKTIEVAGKTAPHIANYALMEKR
jgi:SAM-dependent methyltransferase